MALRQLGYRFLFVWVLLIAFDTVASFIRFPGIYAGYLELWLPLVRLIGHGMLGVAYEIDVVMTGSGDTTFEWIRLLCQLFIAGVVAMIWSAVQPHENRRFAERLVTRSMVRHLVAANMLAYGAIKVLSSQFGDLSPELLIRPFGESSPQVLLWTFMGYSDAYETFTGLAELCAGILLLSRRTTTVGALITIAVMSNVVMLNACYDVPVKLLSSQLLLGACWLAAYDARRVFDALVLGRPVSARPSDAWATNRRALQIARVGHLGFLALAMVAIADMTVMGGADEREPSEAPMGAYAVDEISADTDGRVWQRLIIRDVSVSIQWNDGGLDSFRFEYDVDTSTVTFGPPGRRDEQWSFEYHQAPDGSVQFEGTEGKWPQRAYLRPIDGSDFPLMQRKFRWLSDRESMWD